MVNTCRFMPAANCKVPQTKSLAGVAQKIRPLPLKRSPGPNTPLIALLPDLTMEPRDFSTMFDNPPFLLPGVVLALRSASPLARYRSYQSISRTSSWATCSVSAREVSR
ncbi:hypothetical protein D3C73_1280920 [compost metagenome]